jgi:hypothetical protein
LSVKSYNGICSAIRHHSDHRIEPCFVRGVPEDQADVELHHRGGTVYEVKPKGSPKGPAKVSTRAYRRGWDNIFGGKTRVGEA